MITQSHADPAADPILYLKGERAALGPFTATLVHQYWRWEQEPEVIMGLGRQTPESLEARTIGYESQARSMANQARFTIYDLTTTDPRAVGTTVLRIDHHVRTAEFVIVLGREGRGRVWHVKPPC